MFSAKFSLASGNHRAPGIKSASASTVSPHVSAVISAKPMTLCQNFSRSVMENR